MKYNARWFDGLSSKSREVQVEILHLGLRISIDDAEQAFWPKNEIIEVDHSSSKIIRVHHQKGGVLEVEDHSFSKTISIAYPQQAGQSIADRLSAMSWKTMAAIVLIVGAAVFLTAWTVIPWMGEQAAAYVPRSYEEDLGEAIYEAMLPTLELDSLRTELVNELIRKTDFKTDYDLRFVVVNNEQKNAFALPGGRIVIYTGILEEMKHHSELMGLLAHEVSHVNHRHSLRAIFRQLSTYLFVSLIFNDLSAVSSIVVDQAQQLQSLSYSRSLEREADLEGLELMLHNRYDPMGMPNLFKSMIGGEDKGAEIPEFMSTHPLTNERIDYLKKEIKKKNYRVSSRSEMDQTWEKLKALPKLESSKD